MRMDSILLQQIFICRLPWPSTNIHSHLFEAATTDSDLNHQPISYFKPALLSQWPPLYILCLVTLTMEQQSGGRRRYRWFWSRWRGRCPPRWCRAERVNGSCAGSSECQRWSCSFEPWLKSERENSGGELFDNVQPQYYGMLSAPLVHPVVRLNFKSCTISFSVRQ